MANPYLDSNLRILQARRAALAQSLPLTAHNHPNDTRNPSHDPFYVENHAFYVHNLVPHPDHPEPHLSANNHHHTTPPHHRLISKQKHPTTRARVANPPSKRHRFIANWTPQMDKVIRKALVKHGWGCWTKIASSGKLPQEYTPKMISNRAKAIGLSRQLLTPNPTPAPFYKSNNK